MAKMEQQSRTFPQPKTVAQVVYEHLRQAILDGELEPGTKLNQDSIATELGVSRMPVREALSRLESEGMVIFEAYRGAFVTPLTFEELDQLYLMRLALEPLLARLAAERLETGHVARLEGDQQGMIGALAAGDIDTFFGNLRDFHETLYEAAEKPLILEQVLSLRDLAQRYIRRYLTLPGKFAHAIENHAAVLEAARSNEAGGVEQLIREELEVTRDALLASLSSESEQS